MSQVGAYLARASRFGPLTILRWRSPGARDATLEVNMKTSAFPGGVRFNIVAGSEALGAHEAASILYENGGHRIMTDEAKDFIRASVELQAKDTLARHGIEGMVGSASRGAVGGAVVLGGRTALRQIGAGLGRAAGAGALMDGGVAAVEATAAVQRGEMDVEDAIVHVAIEAATGGVACVCGVALAVGTVALVGTLSAPAVAAISVAGATACKLGLLNLLE